MVVVSVPSTNPDLTTLALALLAAAGERTEDAVDALSFACALMGREAATAVLRDAAYDIGYSREAGEEGM